MLPHMCTAPTSRVRSADGDRLSMPDDGRARGRAASRIVRGRRVAGALQAPARATADDGRWSGTARSTRSRRTLSTQTNTPNSQTTAPNTNTQTAHTQTHNGSNTETKEIRRILQAILKRILQQTHTRARARVARSGCGGARGTAAPDLVLDRLQRLRVRLCARSPVPT